MSAAIEWGMSDFGGQVLWEPTAENVQKTRIWEYCQFLRDHGLGDFCPDTSGYSALHRWSIENVDAFWRSIWNFTDVVGTPGERGYQSGTRFWKSRFFPDGELNFAENLLRPDLLNDQQFSSTNAILSFDEAGFVRSLTRQALFDEVVRLATYFQSVGVAPGDYVAAILPNRSEAVVAMLATALIGAIWTCCAPEFGEDAILHRLGQVSPKVMLVADSVVYNSKSHSLSRRTQQICGKLSSLKSVVICNGGGDSRVTGADYVQWETIQAIEANSFRIQRFPFNHPLTVLYSSGTTGAPKCILHSSGGTLLQHLKEHHLHSDIRRNDTVFYYTTTGWMMWNWLISALASKATIVLYDGSPLHPSPASMWELTANAKLTHFGASPRYYAALEQSAFCPKELGPFENLRILFSTGSPLLASQYHWIYDNIQRDLCLASISGGTDIVSLFILGNPAMPVRAGEMQVKGLGMDVKVLEPDGSPVIGESGELVCCTPFPSAPLGFLNDPKCNKLREAYFDVFPNIWCHGDWAIETEEGGWTISGRSDAVLNPKGVRIGTSEIYQQLKTINQIDEALATALRSDGDEEIVLFLKLKSNEHLHAALIDEIRNQLRTGCSPRHVPAYIVQAPDLPRTITGKLSEIAARNALCGVAIGNSGALDNPESLTFFREWAANL